MLQPGVYPAAVTPFDAKGRIDPLGVAKLLAFFEAAGCQGVVLAGTNGEGPSLSAVEKRDLIKIASGLAGSLDLILGIATPSLDEAVWLSKRAAEFGAVAVLVMPPAYFKNPSEQGLAGWFESVMESSPIPVVAYNFPKMTGIEIGHGLMARIGSHPNCAGCKDSSGNAANLPEYRAAICRPDQRLFVGDETLLLAALESGWSGTISGASNVIGRWIAAIVREWLSGDEGSAREKFALALPAIEAIRAQRQPAANKAALHALGIVPRPDVRLPLEPADAVVAATCLASIRAALGDSI